MLRKEYWLKNMNTGHVMQVVQDLPADADESRIREIDAAVFETAVLNGFACIYERRYRVPIAPGSN